MTSSQPRQNFVAEVEAAINKQINLELYASYCYLSMAYYFDRDDVALPGFFKFFQKQSDEERGHAQQFMKYQNMRGGRIILQNVNKPSLDDWGSGIDAMQAALHLEKTVNQSLLDLHKLASNNNDTQFCDFLENHFLGEQVESIKQFADYVTNLKRVGSGLGEYMFDKETLKGATDS